MFKHKTAHVANRRVFQPSHQRGENKNAINLDFSAAMWRQYAAGNEMQWNVTTNAQHYILHWISARVFTIMAVPTQRPP